MDEDKKWMALAIREANNALGVDEVPIGAIVVEDNKIIGKGHNLRETSNDPTTHAEIVAIRNAAKNKNSWRLCNATLYVTCEPCAMCAGAIVLSRIKRVVFGCKDPKAGACGSIMNVLSNDKLNHNPEVVSGILGNECSKILSDFFKNKRK